MGRRPVDPERPKVQRRGVERGISRLVDRAQMEPMLLAVREPRTRGVGKARFNLIIRHGGDVKIRREDRLAARLDSMNLRLELR